MKTHPFQNRLVLQKISAGLTVLFLLCGNLLMGAEAKADGTTTEDNLATIPEAKDYQLVYDLNIAKVRNPVVYGVNNSANITQPFDRIAYLLELTKDGQSQWVYVSMDAFTADAGKIGVPTSESKAAFQQYVTNLNVFSNVKEIVTGSGLKGNIEFWPYKYVPGNALDIPGASSGIFDFGDTMVEGSTYGSMQVHNYVAKQTLFGFNRWTAGSEACDLGIGNSTVDKRATDWTFAKNGASYSAKRLRVLVRMSPGFPKPTSSSSAVSASPLPAASEPASAPAAKPTAIPTAGLAATPAVSTSSQNNPATTPLKRKNDDGVINRAKNAPGNYDIEFIGDSITQYWEGTAQNVWKKFYGKRKVINMGVSGDRTENVLWRFENGQLDGINAKVAVVMIGVNNKDYPDSDILEGVVAVVNQIRKRQPETKIILLGILPTGKTFNAQRGRLLQVNQALAKLDDGQNIFYLDIGSQLIENDGSIAPDVMKDALHPTENGYRIWANAMEPKLKQLLGE